MAAAAAAAAAVSVKQAAPRPVVPERLRDSNVAAEEAQAATVTARQVDSIAAYREGVSLHAHEIRDKLHVNELRPGRCISALANMCECVFIPVSSRSTFMPVV